MALHLNMIKMDIHPLHLNIIRIKMDNDPLRLLTLNMMSTLTIGRSIMSPNIIKKAKEIKN